MGSVFRKVVTRPIPTTAVVTQCRDGTETAKWTPRGSRRPITVEVVTLSDGRRVVRQESGAYFVRYRDADRVVREVSTGCRDKAAAEHCLADLEKRADRIRAGVMTGREAVAADRMKESLDRHIGDYVERIPGKRGGPASPVHRANVGSYLRRLSVSCGWGCPADLSREDLERWMSDQGRKGRSARSINCHRESAVAFANWLADPLIGRLPSNPFGTGRTALPKADQCADPRRRRALTTDELTRLIDAARNAPERPGTHCREPVNANLARPVKRLTGEARGDLYALLAGTGLRTGEVDAMTVADVRLDDPVPHVRISAAVAKSRREQTVPLRADLVKLLRRYVEGKEPGDSVIEIPRTLIQRFDADCRRAEIPKRDASGRTVDLHCLRHTFGTMLSRAGVPPRVAMELMRHSDIKLTMWVYTDPRLFDLAGAVESLPSVAPPVALSVAALPDNRGHSPSSTGTNEQQSKTASSVA